MLSERELRHVEELIDLLVEAIPRKDGKDGKVQIKEIVFEGSSLTQRKRWSPRKYNRFVAWCAREYKIVTTLNGPIDDPIISFSDRVPVSDTAAIARASGNYLMFTLIGSRKVRVTWLELKRKDSGGTQAPRFEAYRDGDLVFHGVYYAAQGTVFLFGHTPVSPYSRSIYLTRSAERTGDMYGIVSGASNDKMIFASATYAYALGEATMAEYSTHIGEQSRAFVRDEYPEAEKALREHIGVQMDVPRAPDS
jgi:hypothetical protein